MQYLLFSSYSSYFLFHKLLFHVLFLFFHHAFQKHHGFSVIQTVITSSKYISRYLFKYSFEASCALYAPFTCLCTMRTDLCFIKVGRNAPKRIPKTSNSQGFHHRRQGGGGDTFLFLNRAAAIEVIIVSVYI